jgi:hypothetical protein
LSLFFSLDDDSEIGDNCGQRSDRCEQRGQKQDPGRSSYTDREGKFNQGFPFFSLDDDPTNITFRNDLFDFCNGSVCGYLEFFCPNFTLAYFISPFLLSNLLC